MIDTIIFDLDGVLIDSKNIHYIALNKALEKTKISYSISFEDHLKIFDGLPTNEKLKILFEKNVIKKNHFSKIKKEKNKITNDLFKKQISYNKTVFELIKLSKKYKLGVATNAIESTL